MAETVADQVFGRVEALMAEGSAASRAAAIRRVADEMDRSVSATSSAFYAGARKAREAGTPPESAAAEPEPQRAPAGRSSGRRDSAALYAEMAPLVEAGATVEQAARRFGRDEEQAEEIAAGFTRWLARQGGTAPAPDDGGRVATLEAEVRDLRRELERAQRTIARARDVLDEG